MNQREYVLAVCLMILLAGVNLARRVDAKGQATTQPSTAQQDKVMQGYLQIMSNRPTTVPAGSPATQPDIHRLAVHSAALPDPLMKYNFATLAIDRTAGNAATLYLMAAEVTPRVTTFGENGPRAIARNATTRPSPPESAEALAWHYLAMSRPELLASDAPKFVSETLGTVHLMDMAANREKCHWDYPPMDKRPESVDAELLTLGNMRYLLEVLAVRLRWEIAQHQYGDAVRSLRTGFALSTNLSSQANLIQALVSIGSAETMLHHFEELEQAPGAPNLYWALANLPHPFVDIHDVLQNEAVFARPQFQPAAILAPWGPYSQYQQAWDGVYAAFLLPTYAQTSAALDRLENTSASAMAQVMIAPLRRTAMDIMRLDRDIALYQCIEAIRSYAAGHHGKPPATLGELVETPAPPDPMTGKPFAYTVNGQSFTLDAPGPAGFARFGRRMEVTMLPK